MKRKLIATTLIAFSIASTGAISANAASSTNINLVKNALNKAAKLVTKYKCNDKMAGDLWSSLVDAQLKPYGYSIAGANSVPAGKEKDYAKQFQAAALSATATISADAKAGCKGIK